MLFFYLHIWKIKDKNENEFVSALVLFNLPCLHTNVNPWSLQACKSFVYVSQVCKCDALPFYEFDSGSKLLQCWMDPFLNPLPCYA